jgi:hypothetical protein
MSVGQDALIAEIECLKARLQEKEEDIILAAQVGQSLLQEIDRVKTLFVTNECYL